MAEAEKLFVGDPWAIEITVRDRAGAPLDLTGRTLAWGAGPVGAPAAVQAVATSPSRGKAVVALDKTATAGLTPGTWWQQLRVDDVSVKELANFTVVKGALA